jgi:hypothetical protein
MWFFLTPQIARIHRDYLSVELTFNRCWTRLTVVLWALSQMHCVHIEGDTQKRSLLFDRIRREDFSAHLQGVP